MQRLPLAAAAKAEAQLKAYCSLGRNKYQKRCKDKGFT